MPNSFPLVFTTPEPAATVYAVNDSGRGVVLTARTGNSSVSTALIPAISDGGPLSEMSTHLTAAAKAFISDVAGLDANFKGDELAARTRNAAVSRFATILNETQSRGRKNAQDVAVSKVGLQLPEPATVATAHIRAEGIRQFHAADQAGREKMVLSEDTPHEQLAGLIETGLLNGVSDRAREAALERFMITRLIATTGLQAKHELQPSFEFPLAHGPDRKAAREAAKAEIAKLNARSDAVESVGIMLRQLCGVLSSATGLSAQETYNLLVVGKK